MKVEVLMKHPHHDIRCRCLQCTVPIMVEKSIPAQFGTNGEPVDWSKVFEHSKDLPWRSGIDGREVPSPFCTDERVCEHKEDTPTEIYWKWADSDGRCMLCGEDL